MEAAFLTSLQSQKTQTGIPVIRIAVWWTTITISAVAAWFEWQYRRGKRHQAEADEKSSPQDCPDDDPAQKKTIAEPAQVAQPVPESLPKKLRKRARSGTFARR